MVFARSNMEEERLPERRPLGFVLPQRRLDRARPGQRQRPHRRRLLAGFSARWHHAVLRFGPQGRRKAATTYTRLPWAPTAASRPPKTSARKSTRQATRTFPAVAPDGTLYFSSDGQPGLGKLDIFMVKSGKVRNLAAPMNSSGDDFAPVLHGPGHGRVHLEPGRRQRLRRPVHVPQKAAQAGELLRRRHRAGARRQNRHHQPDGRRKGEPLCANGKASARNVNTGPDGKFSAKLDSVTTYTLVAERPGDFAARSPLSTVGRKPARTSCPTRATTSACR